MSSYGDGGPTKIELARTEVKLVRTHWQGWISILLVFASYFAIGLGQTEVAIFLGLGAAGGMAIQVILDWLVG